MEQDLFVSLSTETTEAASETIYSLLLLQLNVPQAFSVEQIQLVTNWLTGSHSKSYLGKAVSYLPCQAKKKAQRQPPVLVFPSRQHWFEFWWPNATFIQLQAPWMS